MTDSNKVIDYAVLSSAPRLLVEAKLKPLQGDRFQPTGFADLGPARYTLADGTEMLLVESVQSVANRMELTCWNSIAQDLITELQGLPYIKILDAAGKHLSNSLLEAHRINSEYARGFHQRFAEEIGYEKDGRVDWKKFHEGLLKYDPNSLIHGCFLEEIGGRLRVTRLLSGFIEASKIAIAESGGVKNNIVQPELRGGEGNVPFPRSEFTGDLRAYFNLDLALLRGYGLPETASRLLIALSLFKIRRFLSTGLRLRTACDLEVEGELEVTRPSGFSIPEEEKLLSECTKLVKECRQNFSDPSVTEVLWNGSSKKRENKKNTDENQGGTEEDSINNQEIR
jgi:CRISPR-associated protein Csb1